MATKKTNKKPKADIDRRTVPHAERGKPVTGQTVDPILLVVDSMNGHELAVIKKVITRFAGGPVKIADLAKSGFGEDNPKLLVRNAIRRLARGDWLKNLGGGAYKLGGYGRAHASEIGKIEGEAPDYSDKPPPAARQAKPKKSKPPKAVKATKVKTAKASAKGKKSKGGAKKPAAKSDKAAPPEQIELPIDDDAPL